MDRFSYRSPPLSFFGGSYRNALEPEFPKAFEGSDSNGLFSGRNLLGSDPDLAPRFNLGLSLVHQHQNPGSQGCRAQQADNESTNRSSRVQGSNLLYVRKLCRFHTEHHLIYL